MRRTLLASIASQLPTANAAVEKGKRRRLAALGAAFGLTKRQLRQRLLTRVHDLAVLDAEVDAIWQAPPTLERIRSYMTSLK
jgi:hypothetical protein